MSNETESFLKHIVLVVVDMQPRMLAVADPDGQALSRCLLAVECAKLLGIKIIFTEQVPDKLGPTHPDLLAAAENPNIQPSYRVFPKRHFSALSVPEVNSVVRERDEHHLLLVGIETPICIYQTAIEAINQDLQVTILSDAVAARRPDDAQWALRSLGSSGAVVLPTETIFYSILRSAEHPAFRSFTELVKRYA